MKKMLTVLALVAVSSTVLAHATYEKRCQTNRGVTRCTTVRVEHRHDHHRHNDGYGDGFFDGMIASTYMVLTTSDAVDGDNKMDAVKNEVSMTLALLSEGIDDSISQDIREEMEAIKAADADLQNASDLEILEAILLAE